MPADPAGILAISRLVVAADGEASGYRSYRLLSDLYVIDNLH